MAGKYKIGDKVRIKSKELLESLVGGSVDGNTEGVGVCVSAGMRAFGGSEFVIERMSPCGSYFYASWFWSDALIECKVEEPTTQKVVGRICDTCEYRTLGFDKEPCKTCAGGLMEGCWVSEDVVEIKKKEIPGASEEDLLDATIRGIFHTAEEQAIKAALDAGYDFVVDSRMECSIFPRKNKRTFKV